MTPLEPVEYTSANADIRLSEPALGVYCSVAHGRATVGVAGAIIQYAERMLAAGRRLLVFHDWQNLKGYDADARKMLTEWTERIEPHWDGSHILFSSPLVAMAVSVASLTMRGKLTSYGSRTTFERALARACAARNQLD
jgi:hypothetical protein